MLTLTLTANEAIKPSGRMTAAQGGLQIGNQRRNSGMGFDRIGWTPNASNC